MSMIKSKFLRNFIPFAAICIGAYLGLAQFRKANYQFKRDEPLIFKEQLNQAGMSNENYQAMMAQSLDEEYKKMIKKIDFDNWENIPGPQPDEDSRKKQEEYRKKLTRSD